jgi:signal transduction histidine kinase
MRERVLHALDLGMLGDWDGAKRSLDGLDDPIVPRLLSLLTEQQLRERDRSQVQAVVRHELGNALAIAQANMEALVDGVLEPTPERLAGIRDALLACGALLEDLKKEGRHSTRRSTHEAPFNICEVIGAQVDLIKGIAESKNVAIRYDASHPPDAAYTEFHGDAERVAHAVRDVLLGAVRYTPPEGTIDVSCARPNGTIHFSVRADRASESALGFSLASKLLETLGGRAEIVAQEPQSVTFIMRLHAAQANAAGM